MLRVTSGHEKGIGLEIFFKSILCLPKTENIILYSSKDAIENTLKSMSIDFSIEDSSILLLNKKIKTNFIKTKDNPVSTSSLEAALSEMNESDILLTLPTSKDQLILNGDLKKGYTEYLRSKYNTTLSMSFLGPNIKVLLITDHIPLKDVPSSITTELIIRKFNQTIKTISNIEQIKDVTFSGINPHAGENGLLGTEEEKVHEAIELIKKEHNDINIKGPVSGDVLKSKNSTDELFVYMYHDQGLSYFKGLNDFIGINLTCGLPFIRLSVDHGTAFDMYGQDRANYSGMLYLLHYLRNHSLI